MNISFFKKRGEGIIKRIKFLKKRGYILRVPGGSSRVGDHSSFGCIYRINKKLEVEILLVPYNPRVTIPRKYEKDDEFKEVPEGTLALKISEQTGLKIYDPVQIGFQKANDKRFNDKRKKHYKYVFVTDKYDDSGIKIAPTTDGRIEVPLWLALPLAIKHICKPHEWIIDKFENYLIKERNFYAR